MYNKTKSVQKKLIIIFLIFTLTYYNFIFIGNKFMKGLISYAIDNETLEEEVIESQEVEEKEPTIEVVNKDIHKTRMEDETEYEEKIEVRLNGITKLELIEVKDKESKFYNKAEEEMEDVTLGYVKTEIEKEKLLNVLGEDGILEIRDEDGKKIAILTEEIINNQVADEKIPQHFEEAEEENLENVLEEETLVTSYLTVTEKNIIIEYANNIKNIEIKLVNINMVKLPDGDEPNEEPAEQQEVEEEKEKAADLEIINTKKITTTEEQRDNLKCLKTSVNYEFTLNCDEEVVEEPEEESETNEEENEEEVEVEEEKVIENVISFKDTITRARLEKEEGEIVAGRKNDIRYKIVLDTTSEGYELFVNPTIVLELPTCVEEIDMTNSGYIIENDGDVFVAKNISGIYMGETLYVIIELEGEQTEESIANGDAQINLKLNVLIGEEQEEQVVETKMYYKNGTVTAYEGLGEFGKENLEMNIIIPAEEPVEEPENPEDPTEPEDPENPGEEPENPGEPEEELPYESFYTDINFNDVDNKDDRIVKVGEEFEYAISLYNMATEEIDVRIEDIIPEGLEYVGVSLYNYNNLYADFVDEVDITEGVEYNQKTRKLTVTIDRFDAATLETVGTEIIEEEDEETGEIIEKEVEVQIPKQAAKLLKIKVKPSNLQENIFMSEINNEVKVFVNEEEHSTLSLNVTISDHALEFTVEDIAKEYKLDDFVTIDVTLKNNGQLDSNPVNLRVELPEELNFVRVDANQYSSSVDGNNYSEDIVINAGEEYKMTLTAQYTIDPEQDKNVEIKLYFDNVEKVLETTLLTNVRAVTEPGDYPVIDPGEHPGETPGENPGGEPGENPGENPGTNPGEEPGENPGEETPGTNPDKDDEETQVEGFDLSLKQSLKKITLTTAQGTTEYKYNNNEKFAKIEIPSKYVNGSVVSLEYKIVIKNNGTVEGYARKIVDYIPQGTEFNSELNPDWYVGDDGNLYSVKYIDKLLKPGETEELSLILTKKMNNVNTGTIKNVAEIYEATNDQGLEDVNSIPGSKIANENDMSTVEVIIAVRTGSMVVYTMLVLTILAILIYGIYNVKKVTLKNKEDK